MGTSSSQSVINESIIGNYHQLQHKFNGYIIQQNINCSQHYFLRQFSYINEQQYLNKLQNLQQLIKLQQNQNILNLLKIEGKQFHNFCSTSYKIYALYQMPQVSLFDEIYARLKQKKYFQQSQLWSILQSATNALKLLDSTININAQKIFIVPDGGLKLIHNDMINCDYRCIVEQGVYYAPEKMENFHNNSTHNSLLKEAIFSLGMTLLHSALLSSVSQCYDYQQRIFKQQVLIVLCQKVQQMYSQEFVTMLAAILSPKPEQRIDLQGLQQILANYWDSQSEQAQQNTQKQLNSLNSLKQPIIKLQQQKLQQQLIYKKSSYSTQNIYNNNNNNNINLPNQNINKQNLYTDPKLLAMIKKDLQDINQLKKSSMYHYQQVFTHHKSSYHSNFLNQHTHFPQTQSLLSSQQNVLKNTQINTTVNTMKNTIQSNQNTKPLQINNTNTPIILNNSKQNNEKQTNLIEVDQIFEDGIRYIGFLLNDQKHGYGKLIYQDGAYYEGNFEKDQINGYGILYYHKNKPAYDGTWMNGQFHGKGILYNENPYLACQIIDYNDLRQINQIWVTYTGQFQYDNKHGYGKLILSNGDYLEGQFQKDLVNGKAIYVTNNGDRICGQWQNNMLHILNDEQTELHS